MPSILLRSVAFALAVIGLAMSLVLLCVCTSTTGAVFGSGGVLLSGAVILGCVAWAQQSRALWRGTGLAFAGWLAVTGWLVMHAPDGRTAADAPVQHRYLDDHWAFRRYALGNLLPEADQLALGFKLMPAMDSLFSLQQARLLSGATATLYQEMEADPAFHALGSVLPDTYDELWGQPFEHGHYFMYVPPGLDRHQPQPVLLFLHGSGGNFKAYTWVLSQVARKLGMVLIAPSYGMGNWREPDTSHLLEAVMEDAAKVAALDIKNVHLMGLSNGGLGVSQAGASTMGAKLRSLTFISPVFSRSDLLSDEFIERWRNRPVLVVTGREDNRVPLDYVREGVEVMTNAGAKVTFTPVDGASHFMLFTHRDQVVSLITQWLQERLKEAGPKRGVAAGHLGVRRAAAREHSAL